MKLNILNIPGFVITCCMYSHCSKSSGAITQMGMGMLTLRNMHQLSVIEI